jgi:hypothetical protein
LKQTLIIDSALNIYEQMNFIYLNLFVYTFPI